MSFPINNNLKSFCYCMSLRTGSRVISSITMFVCSLNLLTTWMKFTVYHARGAFCKQDNNEFIKYGAFHKSDIPIGEISCPTNSIELFMIIFQSVIYLLGFLSSVLLMYAIKTKQPRLFVSWMMFTCMVLFSTFFYILFWRHPRYVVPYCLSFLIQFYFFGVVSAYHQQLVEEQTGVTPPVVAIALPRDSRLGRTRADFEVSDPVPRYDPTKFDPPPPYPGPPTEFDSSIEPPAYSLCNPHYACMPPMPNAEMGILHSTSDTPQGGSTNSPVIVIPLQSHDETDSISSCIETPRSSQTQPNNINTESDEGNSASAVNVNVDNEANKKDTANAIPSTVSTGSK